jgi:hypothetical protein
MKKKKKLCAEDGLQDEGNSEVDRWIVGLHKSKHGS